VFFAHDGNDQRFAQEMMRNLESIGAQDITSEDMLWRVLGET